MDKNTHDPAAAPLAVARRPTGPQFTRLSTLNKRVNAQPSIAGPGSESNRTLLDIIVDDDDSNNTGDPPRGWRGFKDHMRLRAGAAFFTTNDNNTAARPALGRCTSVRPPSGNNIPEENEEGEEGVGGPPTLMALLDLGGYGADDEDNEDGAERDGAEGEEDEEEEDDENGDDGGMHVCCVCMVRHKGAPFVPCRHSFCRLCSRELRVSSGNCPLCNGFILEILDVF